MLRALLRRSLPTPPVLCCRMSGSTAAGGGSARQTKKQRVASSSSLWVSYMDIATVRKRLVSVAQEVRFQPPVIQRAQLGLGPDLSPW